jgi:uncharacterized Zn finger protein (UPF0148 family)
MRFFMKNCPKCGFPLNDSDTVCPECQRLHDRAVTTSTDGAVLKRDIYCSHCGAPISESSKFCTSCGSAAASSRTPAMSPKSKTKYWFVLIPLSLVIWAFTTIQNEVRGPVSITVEASSGFPVQLQGTCETVHGGVSGRRTLAVGRHSIRLLLVLPLFLVLSRTRTAGESSSRCGSNRMTTPLRVEKRRIRMAWSVSQQMSGNGLLAP